MARYRKKPVVIEAFQFTMGIASPPWFQAAVLDGKAHYQGGPAPFYTIETTEGAMRANLGDWIIKGTHGEIYPCKPHIFAAIYEEAPD